MSDLKNRTGYAILIVVVEVLCFGFRSAWPIFIFALSLICLSEILWQQFLALSAQKLLPGVFLPLILSATVGFGAYSAIQLRHTRYGSTLIIVNAVAVMGTDTFAYFIGKKWGKHKLAPVISPNKTREGLFGGIFVGSVLAGVVLFLSSWVNHTWGKTGIILAMILLTCVVAEAGDLLESYIKRKLGIKDFSRLLGDHGGFMDRFDAMFTVFATVGIWQIAVII